MLTVEETDKALRLKWIARLAERVFGDFAKAHRWLRKLKCSLAGRITPTCPGGAEQVCGRWNSRGRRIVYLSDHPASALLEVLVRLEVDSADLPPSDQLLAVDILDRVAFDRILEDELALRTRRLREALGDHWLQEKRTLLLQVPLAPASLNWLFNSAHADASSARIAKTIRAPFDSRLFKTA